jgi:hypothetical protein
MDLRRCLDPSIVQGAYSMQHALFGSPPEDHRDTFVFQDRRGPSQWAVRGLSGLVEVR